MGDTQVTRAQARLSWDQAGKSGPVASKMAARLIGLLAVVLLAGDSAFGDLLVQPMLLRVTVQPGQRYARELKLENSDPQVAETLTLRMAELTQKPDGSWTELKAGDPNLSTANLRSCKSWLTVPSGNITVGAYQITPFTLQIEVPPSTKGFYFASIVAATLPRMVTLPTGVLTAMNMEMVVPVILEVQNTPPPRRVDLTDVGLDPQPQTEATPAASNLTLDVVNSGGTFSRVLPIVRLWAQSGGHWQIMLNQKFKEIAIMPGAKLHLKQDAGQPLASGLYRLEGFVYVDGQRGSRIQREVQFKGDPRIPQKQLGQIPVTIQPSPLFIEMIPGATRTTSVTVMNGSEEDVTVNAAVDVPEHMMFAANAKGVRGEQLNCSSWVTVAPEKFTLKGHARQSLKIVAAMPKEAAKYPSFYATLKLALTHMDGLPAGTKNSWICLQNKPVTGAPLLGATVLTVSETSPARYLVTGAFSNTGETHANSLTCQGVLSVVGGGGTGAAVYKRFLMTSEAEGQRGILLPFESRTFAGVLDVSDVPPNDYYVTAVLKWPGSTADGVQEQRVIRVAEQGGRRVARMLTAAGVPPVKITMQ